MELENIKLPTTTFKKNGSRNRSGSICRTNSENDTFRRAQSQLNQALKDLESKDTDTPEFKKHEQSGSGAFQPNNMLIEDVDEGSAKPIPLQGPKAIRAKSACRRNSRFQTASPALGYFNRRVHSKAENPDVLVKTPGGNRRRSTTAGTTDPSTQLLGTRSRL
jgi:hypothetical protein